MEGCEKPIGFWHFALRKGVIRWQNQIMWIYIKTRAEPRAYSCHMNTRATFRTVKNGSKWKNKIKFIQINFKQSFGKIIFGCEKKQFLEINRTSKNTPFTALYFPISTSSLFSRPLCIFTKINNAISAGIINKKGCFWKSIFLHFLEQFIFLLVPSKYPCRSLINRTY